MQIWTFCKRVAPYFELAVAAALLIILHGAAARGIEQLLQEFKRFDTSVVLSIQDRENFKACGRDEILDEHDCARTTRDLAHVGGVAPPGREVNLLVGGMLWGRYRADGAGHFAATIPLREDVNSISAEVIGPADRYRSDRQSRIYLLRSSDARPSALTIVSQQRRGTGTQTTGFTASNVFSILQCVPSHRGFRNHRVRVDMIGGFQVFAPGRGKVYLHFEGSDDLHGLLSGRRYEACDPDYFQRFDLATDDVPAILMRRRLDVRAEERKLVAIRASVQLPPGTALEQWARQRLLSPAQLLEALFGVQADYAYYANDPREDQAGDPPVTVEEDGASVTLRAQISIPATNFEINPVEQGRQSELPPFMSLPGDRLQIHAASLARVEFTVPPTSRENVEGAARFRWTEPLSSARPLRVVLQGEQPGGDGSEAEAALKQQPRQNSPIPALNRLRDSLPDNLSAVGFQLVKAVPFIWFLIVFRRRGRLISPDRAETLRLFVIGLLLLHMSYALVWFIQFDFYGWSKTLFVVPDDSAAARLNDAVRWLVPGVFPVLLLGVVYLYERIDLLAGRSIPKDANGDGPVWWFVRRFILWTIAPAIIVLLPFALNMYGEALPEGWGRYPYTPLATVLLATVVLFGWLTIYWFLRRLFGRRIPLRTAIATSLVLLFVPSIPALADKGYGLAQQYVMARNHNPFYWDISPAAYAWGVICIAAGMLLLYRLGQRSLAVMEWERDPVSRPWWHIPSMLVFLFVAAFPISVFYLHPANQWTFVDLYRQVEPYLPVLLLLAIYQFMRFENPRSRFWITPGEYGMGALLFSFYLCGGSANLLSIPLPLMLGYYLYRRHLFTRPRGPREFRRFDLSALDLLATLKDAQNLERVYRKGAEKKYSEGELSREDFEKGLALAESRVAAAKAALPCDEDEVRRRAFSIGPGAGPHGNALLALLYSLPLMLLFQVSALDQALTRTTQSFPLLEAPQPVIRWIAYWAVLAFFFGYFFHMLRGRDGRMKGVSLVGAIVLCTLVALALDETPIIGVTSGERILRIALFVFTLAFMFDLQVVRRAGLRLKHLVLIYGGIPALAFGSSLAALGGLSLGPVLKISGCWLLHVMGIDACYGTSAP